jgi:coenzyme F420-0:L-glutamate ligase / coenzyme F420-1:gamma-L-glutamate ligase
VPPADRLEAVGIPGLPEVGVGDDLAGLLVAGLRRAGLELRDGDLLVISSKIVSKAEGRARRADSREAAVRAETVRVVAERLTPRGVTRIVQSRSGPVLAAAGVDASNVAPGTVLLLPQDPDASAAALRHRLAELTGVPAGRLGVVISDTAGRPWRDGQTDIAIGASGIRVVDDLRGGTDPLGNPLEVTVRAVADQLAALADLVKGKLDGVPAALVRGQSRLLTGPGQAATGAAALIRTGAGDWFRLGHVEAARAAIGVEPDHPVLEPARVPPEPPADRLRRAVEVALAGADPLTSGIAYRSQVWLVSDGPPGDHTVRVQLGAPGIIVDPGPDDWVAVGALAQRIAVAAWSEDLVAQLRVEPGPPPALLVRTEGAAPTTASATPPG